VGNSTRDCIKILCTTIHEMVGEISSKIEGLDLNARCLRMFISFEIIRQCALIILRLVLGTLHRPKVRNAYNAID
jgi:hypothetical protein